MWIHCDVLTYRNPPRERRRRRWSSDRDRRGRVFLRQRRGKQHGQRDRLAHQWRHVADRWRHAAWLRPTSATMSTNFRYAHLFSAIVLIENRAPAQVRTSLDPHFRTTSAGSSIGTVFSTTWVFCTTVDSHTTWRRCCVLDAASVQRLKASSVWCSLTTTQRHSSNSGDATRRSHLPLLLQLFGGHLAPHSWLLQTVVARRSPRRYDTWS